MGKTLKRLVSYYKPYKGLFFSDLFFAILGAGITLVIPLIVRYITSTVVNQPVQEATDLIVKLGIFMVRWCWLRRSVIFILPITGISWEQGLSGT